MLVESMTAALEAKPEIQKIQIEVNTSFEVITQEFERQIEDDVALRLASEEISQRANELSAINEALTQKMKELEARDEEIVEEKMQLMSKVADTQAL